MRARDKDREALRAANLAAFEKDLEQRRNDQSFALGLLFVIGAVYVLIVLLAEIFGQ